MAVETEANKYNSMFTLMAQSDDDNEDNEEILTIELGEAEQFRDDLVVCVVDLNETIANLEQEKEALNERITSVENEREDLMVVVVDLKETIHGLSNEKHTLEEKVASTEEERADLLVICTDLEETIKGLNREHMNVNLGKGKEVARRECILEKKVKGTFSVNEKAERFLWHSSGNEHYVNVLKKCNHQSDNSPSSLSGQRKQEQSLLLVINLHKLIEISEASNQEDDKVSKMKETGERQRNIILHVSQRTCQSYDLIKDHIRGLTPRVLEAPKDDPDQYLNSSMLDSVTLKESPEKEATHNIMAISAKSLMNEGAYLSSEYQREDIPFLGDVRTTTLLEFLDHEIFSETPSDEPDSLPRKLIPAPPVHSKLLESSSKSPITRSLKQENFESSLQKSKRSVKTRKKRKMNPKDFIKSVSVNQIDKNASREPGSLVQQSMTIKETVEE
ncbi:uncharacterized protein [Nicotiana sylvestris]|uniref:uncharacterized protein n=1 Tax=Nicotiana sylvestris TaxID=4096 RepID=UPI00388CAF31